jgi:uncharacterized damage-inducible protein DinB
MRTSIMLVVLACSPAALAADKAAPAPASAVEETLGTWNEEGRKLVAMAEDFPEAKYDYKPSPEMRSFAEQLLHVASGNAGFLGAMQTGKWVEADLSRKTYDTKAKLVALLKKSIADDAAFITKTGDAGMMKPMKSPWAPQKIVTPMGFWLDAAGHMAEHYGQLVVYYRLNKLVPPESRPKK